MELRVTSFYGKATVLWDEGSVLCTHAHEILIEVTLAWSWACLELAGWWDGPAPSRG